MFVIAYSQYKREYKVDKKKLAMGKKLADNYKAGFKNCRKIIPWLENAPILLKKEEKVILNVGASFHEERAYRNFYGGTLKVAKGVNFFAGQSLSASKLSKIDVGKLIITNKRIVFLGSKRTNEIPISRIISVDSFENGIAIHKTNKSRVEVYVSHAVHIIKLIVKWILKYEFVLDDDDLLIDMKYLQYCNQRVEDVFDSIQRWKDSNYEGGGELESVMKYFLDDVNRGKLTSVKAVSMAKGLVEKMKQNKLPIPHNKIKSKSK